MNSFDQISKQMTQAGITPSIQRIKIMEYLLECQCHPTVERIYKALGKKCLNISKATVYNTLKLFAQKGLVRVLTMEDNENHYDVLMHEHGHFICEECGTVFDFDIDADKVFKTDSEQLKGCTINQKDIYFKGVCNRCLYKK